MAGALILHAGRRSTPEQQLVAAIIAQAFEDLNGTKSSDETTTAQADLSARQSIHFLTDSYGGFARWRNELCSFIDLDGDVLAERVRKILDGDLPWPDSRVAPDATDRARKTYTTGTKRLEEDAARARALWQDLK